MLSANQQSDRKHHLRFYLQSSSRSQSFSLESSCKVWAAEVPQVWTEKQENSFKMKVGTKEGFETSKVLMVGSLHDSTVSGFQRETEQRLTAGKGVTLNPAASSRKCLMVCSRKGTQQLHSKSGFMFWLICDFCLESCAWLKVWLFNS